METPYSHMQLHHVIAFLRPWTELSVLGAASHDMLRCSSSGHIESSVPNLSSQIITCAQERRVPKSWQRAADKTAARVDSSTSSDQVPASM